MKKVSTGIKTASEKQRKKTQQNCRYFRDFLFQTLLRFIDGVVDQGHLLNQRIFFFRPLSVNSKMTVLFAACSGVCCFENGKTPQPRGAVKSATSRQIPPMKHRYNKITAISLFNPKDWIWATSGESR